MREKRSGALHAKCDQCGRQWQYKRGGRAQQYVGAVVKAWGIESSGKRIYGDFVALMQKGINLVFIWDRGHHQKWRMKSLYHLINLSVIL